MLAFLFSPMGRAVALAGVVLTCLWWWRGHIIETERTRAALAAQKARIENIQDAERVEDEIQNLDDDALRDALKRRLLPVAPD